VNTVEVITDSNVTIAVGADDDGTIVVLAPDDVETIATGEQGPPGAPGAPGAPGLPSNVPGPPGNTILYGSGNPDASIGRDGDFYINTTTHFIFGPKSSGAWPTGTSLIGPQGTAGNTVLYGASDPATATGVDGNFYINTTTHFMFGPKAGMWPAGTSLVGPQGAQGVPGPTGPPGTDGAGAPATVPPLMDGTAAVGTSLLFARQDHIHPFDTATVRNNAAQSLTSTQQQQARQNIYAAPFDALAYNGLQINGAMEVSQQNGTTNIGVSGGVGKYIVDGFVFNVAGSGIGSSNQSAIGSLPPFTSCLTVTCTGANPLSGANDAQYIYQPIEGYRWSRLGFGFGTAQPVTVGFWIYPQSAGTIAVALRNGGGTRSYVVDVPLLANQWQYKTITFPGCVDGTWPTDNTIAAMLSFCYGAGTGLRGAANSWLTGGAISTGATTNFFATNTGASTIYLTGVTIHSGNAAPTAAQSPLIMRPYDQELVTCQRYWQYMDGNIAAGIWYASSLRPIMRAAPTLVMTNIASSVVTAYSFSYYNAAQATMTAKFDARL
jgi:hypothetical protein